MLARPKYLARMASGERESVVCELCSCVRKFQDKTSKTKTATPKTKTSQKLSEDGLKTRQCLKT